MIKFISILFALIVGLPYLTFSQQDSSRKVNFIVKTDIFLPVLGLCTFYKDYYCSITLEKCFNNNQSIQLTGRYFYQNTRDFDDSQYEFGDSRKISTVKIIPEYRYFLGRKESYSGFYTGAYLKYCRQHEKREIHSDFEPYYKYVDFISNTISLGPIFGYQKYLWKRFVFETFIGCGYRYDFKDHVIESVNFKASSIKSSSTDLKIGKWTDLRVGVNIGYKF